MDKGNKIILFSVILIIYIFLSILDYIEYKISYDNELNDEKINFKILYLFPWALSSIGAIFAQIKLKYTKKYLIINNISALIFHIILFILYFIFV